MKQIRFYLALCLVAAPFLVFAQTTTAPADLQNPRLSPTPNSRAAQRANSGALARYQERQKPPKPFSRIGISGGVSTMGVNMQVATNLNKYLNVRGVGNYLSYTMNNQDIDSYTVNGKLNLATGGVSLDFYPFPNHGLRLSGGVLFYNDNAGAANVKVAGGTKLELNDYSYYSSSTNPITGNGSITLNARKPTPTATIGWGNLISRRGGHWSVPVELGAAFMGTAGINVALTGGQACDAFGLNCVNVATDPTVQSNLQAQIQKYRNNASDYPFYPIFSVGLGYNFHIR
ncbi:MAG: hypothetical protein P4K83_12370 [Terracidiphilus sp.]|nr:hypothetical protein [Terracidiphilus sp.]